MTRLKLNIENVFQISVNIPGMKAKKILNITILTALLLQLIPAAEAKPLLRDLQTGSYEQQLAAIYYFGYSGNKKAFWYFVKNLEKEFNGSQDVSWGVRLRQAAAVSLGRLRDRRGVPFLTKRYGKEKNSKVKRAIMYGLSFYKADAESSGVIKDGLLSDNRQLMIESLNTAAVSGDKSLTGRIKEIISGSKDPEIKLVCSYALIMLGENAAGHIKPITSQLVSPMPEMRFLSAYYLKRSGYFDAAGEVLKAIEIENYQWVRREMEECLYRLNWIRREKIEKEKPY
jgi:hypothetical protein